jgi:aldose 1-epimerase
LTVELPSGEQWEIRHGSQRAVAVEVGAALREYEVDGQPILDGFAVDRMSDGGRGQPLLPWPNRLADGRYEFGGRSLQLPIEEISRNNATHGLTRWLNWRLASRSDARVELELLLHPRPGYPFTLGLCISYSLDENGLSVETRAENLGDESLPFGAGQHPYLTVGTPTLDTAVLRIPADCRLELDEQRRLPTGQHLPTHGSDFDFRMARPIGGVQLDECFTDLQREADGRARVLLASPDGRRRLSLWLGERYKYLQVFTGDTLPLERRRRGLAIEPMTCPPNAFRTATDLLVLEPGTSVDLAWGIEF